MDYCMQYHNYGRLGLPMAGRITESCFVDQEDDDCYTRLQFVKNELWNQVFLIVGIGKSPPKFFLWDTFEIKRVRYDNEQEAYRVSGPGWMLNPPQLLEGSDFDQFRKNCANFAAFKRIGHLKYAQKLHDLAEKFRRTEIDQETLEFCEGLVDLIPDDLDASKLLNYVRRQTNAASKVTSESTSKSAKRSSLKNSPTKARESSLSPQMLDEMNIMADAVLTKQNPCKVLSVRQPHAHFLVTPQSNSSDVPLKWCENRSWEPDLTNLAPSPLKNDQGLPRILIHASNDLDRDPFNEEDEEDGGWWEIPNVLKSVNSESLPRSAIIGSVRLIGVINVVQLLEELGEMDCTETPVDEYLKLRKRMGLKTPKKSVSPTAQFADPCPLYEGEELFWWFVDRPLPLANPILGVKGRLNLWTYPFA